MKQKLIIALLMMVAVATFQSCGDSDSAPKKVLIVGSMETGQFYKINTKTGSLTTLFVPTFNEQPLHNVRSIVYHPGVKKFFGTLTRQSVNGPKVFSLDPSTNEATIINDNLVTPWYQLSTMMIADDDSLFTVGDLSNGIDGFVKFSTSGARSTRNIVSDNAMCCGYGMVHFSKQNEIVVANGNYQDDAALDFDIFNENGEYQSTTTFTTFNGFDRDYLADSEWLTIRSIASESSSKTGTVYAVMVEYNEGRTHLVKLDFEEETVTHIALLDFNGDYDYAALTFVSASVVD
jgi:uncharacterized protein YqfB (UPF0267 family)